VLALARRGSIHTAILPNQVTVREHQRTRETPIAVGHEPMKFEPTITLQTVTSLALRIPQSVLSRADEIVR
jgi:hypothetical protein